MVVKKICKGIISLIKRIMDFVLEFTADVMQFVYSHIDFTTYIIIVFGIMILFDVVNDKKLLLISSVILITLESLLSQGMKSLVKEEKEFPVIKETFIKMDGNKIYVEQENVEKALVQLYMFEQYSKENGYIKNDVKK